MSIATATIRVECDNCHRTGATTAALGAAAELDLATAREVFAQRGWSYEIYEAGNATCDLRTEKDFCPICNSSAPSELQAHKVIAAAAENPVVEAVTRVEDESRTPVRIWEVPPEDADKTIAPGIYFGKACPCGTCAIRSPKHVIGYLRFRAPGETRGVTLFIYDPTVYDIIDNALRGVSAKEQGDNLSILAPLS